MGFSLHQVKTPGGYYLTEVSSALQKCIRRGMEKDALFWATELDLAGFANYAWKRMRVITSEDIGLADPTLPASIQALYAAWSEYRTKRKRGEPAPRRDPGRLFFVHAVLLLCRAPKSRIVDHATITFYKGRSAMKFDIPDFALDMHTIKGKQMKRGIEHFFEEGSKLRNQCVLSDEYLNSALAALTQGEGEGESLELFDEE